MEEISLLQEISKMLCGNFEKIAEDRKEKSFQVGLMAKIYQQAHQVFAWLGPADKSSESAIRCINTIGKMAEECRMRNAFEKCLKTWQDMECVPGGSRRLVSVDPVFQDIDGSTFTVSRKAFQDLSDVFSGQSNQSDLLPIAELREFFTRSWWARVWILQEITLSRDTRLICGAQTVTRYCCDAFIHMYADVSVGSETLSNSQLLMKDQ
ncbi:unnamed protein product [Alternaria sp. RS040]